jgi:hypothetical protein
MISGIMYECQGYGTATKKPRRISAVLWPIEGPQPEPTVPPTLPPCVPLQID